MANTDKQILVASLYRPPNPNVKNFLDCYKNLFWGLHDTDLIIGLDHNLNLLNYHDHADTRDFLESLVEMEHFPCITRPTRLTHHSATLIDNIIVSKMLHCIQHSGIITSDLSDHLPCLTVLHEVKSCKGEPAKIIKRNLSKKNISKIIEKLQNINLEYIVEHDHDVDLCMNYYHDKVMTCIDSIAPE